MNTRRTAILATLAAAAGAGACFHFLPGMSSSSRPRQMTPEEAKTLGFKMLSFVHYNDLHGHYHPKNYNGRYLSPLSLIRGYFDEVKAENPNSIFCNAGDDMEKGSVVEFLSKGESTIDIYKHLGLDLRALGNHDFAYGLESVKKFVNEPGDVVLCSNQLGLGKSFHQFEIDGIRVGVFAMVCRPWDERDQQYDGPYFKGVECGYDFSNLARKMIRKHRKDVDLLFMLSHLGLGDDEQVARESQGLDFIIGGHSHSVLPEPRYSPSGTVIVQAGSYGEYVGRLDIMLDPSSRRMAGFRYALKTVDPATMAPNLALESKIREVFQRHAPDVDAPITNLPARLDRLNVAKLACDAAIAVFGVDAAIIDGSTVWGELSAGPIVRQDLLDAFTVEIQPPGTHGFNSMMTGTLDHRDWEILNRGTAGGQFSVSIRGELNSNQPVRVAMQRRTALGAKDYFSGIRSLKALRFEMETWEMLARHLSTRV